MANNNFEIGQRVFWEISSIKGKTLLRGLFMKSVDETLSEVRCYEKDERHCNFKLDVITDLLQLDGNN